MKIGRVESTDIYVADLSKVGFDINSITLPDSNSRQGGSGGTLSGFDLDNVMLSRVGLTTLGTVNVNDDHQLPKLDVFDYSASGIVFRPGTQNARDSDPTPDYNGPDLVGTINGIIVNPATLGVRDGDGDPLPADGIVSLGDGGAISFNLNQAVSTAGGLYLYVGEYGGIGEVLSDTLTVSDQRTNPVTDLSTDFGEVGAANDTTTMTFSFNKLASSSDDTILFSFVMFSEELPEFAGSASTTPSRSCSTARIWRR